jgi:hypothetical protein
MRKKNIFRFVKLLAIIYAMGGIAVYFLQDYFFFRPVPLTRNHHFNFKVPYREVNLGFDRISNINIIQFETGMSKPRGVVLYFHGNRRNISWYARFAPLFTAKGYEVWMIDYPGFGKSTGKLEVQILYAYARQLYKLARTRFQPGQIVLYGKSMGTGIAAQLASVEPARQLILETPYYSLASVAATYLPFYPMERLIRLNIPTFDFIRQARQPVTIFHGTKDFVIPYSNAGKLRSSLKGTDEFITIEGAGHNNLHQYRFFREKLDSLLNLIE